MQKNKDVISGIYCIENKINHKKYIGQSINIYDRWNKHKSELNHNKHDNDYLQKSWNKYGNENFLFFVLEECLKDDLNMKEIYYINKYNTLNQEYGYNLKEGGSSGKISEYSNEKKKQSLKKAYENKKLREERKKYALYQWSNPEIKNKIMGENNGMYGKTHTEETRQKIREKALGRESSQKNKTPVFCEELDKVFNCASDAAKELLLRSSAILQVCYGNRKTCGGYHWKFMENNI